jgi:hypothetical protein
MQAFCWLGWGISLAKAVVEPTQAKGGLNGPPHLLQSVIGAHAVFDQGVR